jgi:hypothetical protein
MSTPLLLTSIKQYKEKIKCNRGTRREYTHWKAELPHIMYIMKYTLTKQKLTICK